MDKDDFFDLENKINNSINNTFNLIDDIAIKAEELKDNIINGTNEVKNNIKNNTMDLSEKIDSIRKEQINKMNEKMKAAKNTKSNVFSNYDNNNEKEDKLRSYVAKRAPGGISGVFLIIIGSFFTAVFGISVISYSIITSFKSVFSVFNVVSLGILFSLLGISIASIFKGAGLRNRSKRFKQYVKCLKGHEYCEIEEFARSVGKKKKFVIKDLNKMIDLGLFKEANMDENQKYFMLGDEVYENYLRAEEAFRQREEDEIKRKEEYKEAAEDPEKAKLMKTINLCRTYIESIKEINDSITDFEFSKKLDRMQKVVSEILNCIEKNPMKLGEVNKFTNHYLPITLKLVTSYKELTEQEVQGDNIKAAKNEIEKSIDIINKAFEKLLDDLFEEMALDISTDISVLKTLFTQDGLTKKDFEK